MAARRNRAPRILGEPNYALIVEEARNRKVLFAALRAISLLQSGPMTIRKGEHWMSLVPNAHSELEASLVLWSWAEEIIPQAECLGRRSFSDEQRQALLDLSIHPASFVNVCRKFESHLRHAPCQPCDFRWESILVCLYAGMRELVFARRGRGQFPVYEGFAGGSYQLPVEPRTPATPLLLGIPLALAPNDRDTDGRKILQSAIPLSEEIILSLEGSAISSAWSKPEYDKKADLVVSYSGFAYRPNGSTRAPLFFRTQSETIGRQIIDDVWQCAPVLAQAILQGLWSRGLDTVDANFRQVKIAAQAYKDYGIKAGIIDEVGLKQFYEEKLVHLGATALIKVTPRQLRLPQIAPEVACELIRRGVDSNVLSSFTDTTGRLICEGALADLDLAARSFEEALRELPRRARPTGYSA